MSYKDDAAKSRVEKLKHYADGGRLESTRIFKAGIDYSDPDQDDNYHNEGSRGAIKEAFDYEGRRSDRNTGQGPRSYGANSNPSNWMKTDPVRK